jgi:hypothetical protein
MKRILSISRLFSGLLLGGRRFDDRGVAIVEFALVMPILLLMTFGVIEIGMIMAVQSTLEGGLKEASRYGITGNTPSDSGRIEKIRAILEDHTIDLVDMSEAKFLVITYPSFSGVGQPEPFVDSAPDPDRDPTEYNCANGKFDDPVDHPTCNETYTEVNGEQGWQSYIGTQGAGLGGEVVSYTVTVPWHVMTPFVGPLMAPDGVIPLTATIVVRNEPNLWPGSSSGGSGGMSN